MKTYFSGNMGDSTDGCISHLSEQGFHEWSVDRVFKKHLDISDFEASVKICSNCGSWKVSVVHSLK